MPAIQIAITGRVQIDFLIDRESASTRLNWLLANGRHGGVGGRLLK